MRKTIKSTEKKNLKKALFGNCKNRAFFLEKFKGFLFS